MADLPPPGAPGLPTTGHHVFVPEIGSGSELVLDGGAGHHLATVLRVRSGEPVSLADDTGVVAQAVVTDVARGRVGVEVEARYDVDEDGPRVAVVQSVPKGRKLEEVVQRLTEVGADRLVPVHTARSVKQVKGDKADKVAERLHAVAVAAAQQSRRARLLRIEPVGGWPAEAVAGLPGVVLWERATEPIGAALAELPTAEEVVVAVGPEGGLELREVEESGLVPVALGRTILRTETAGVVGAALAMHHLGRLG